MAELVAVATRSALRADSAVRSALLAAEEAVRGPGRSRADAAARVLVASRTAAHASAAAAEAAAQTLERVLEATPSSVSDLTTASSRERDIASKSRDDAALLRDRAGELRDAAASARDAVATSRDEVAEQGDRLAEQRDVAADLRDAAAVERDSRAYGRERSFGDLVFAADVLGEDLCEQLQAIVSSLPDGARSSIATELARAIAENRRTVENRARAAFDELRAAVRDRDEASDDRAASRVERGQSASDRSTSLTDRGASQEDRMADPGAAGSAAQDRTATQDERAHARHDRDDARVDRTIASQESRRRTRDGLTGVYLRGEGSGELVREIDRANRTGEPLTITFVDVDGLKSTNDRLGHAAGDRMIVEVAQALRSTLRPDDLVIRWGGDEFVCVLAGCSLTDAERRMAEVNDALAAGTEHGSISVGIARLRDDETEESLVSRADAALYQARRDARRDT